MREENDGIAVYVPKDTILKEMAAKIKLSQHFFTWFGNFPIEPRNSGVFVLFCLIRSISKTIRITEKWYGENRVGFILSKKIFFQTFFARVNIYQVTLETREETHEDLDAYFPLFIYDFIQNWLYQQIIKALNSYIS
jgi:hypothetical protein